MGSVDPRPLALFRIGFGLILLHDLFDLTHDFRAFLTEDGMLPRGVEHLPFAWSVFNRVGSPLAVGLLFTLGVMAVVAFTVGFQTRVATSVGWVFLASIHNRNVFITDAGDDLARILLFWSIFADLGECYGATRFPSCPLRARPQEHLRHARLHVREAGRGRAGDR